MTVIQIDSGQANALQIEIDSGEVSLAGQVDGSQIVVAYGYFVAGQEIVMEDSMRPELQPSGTGLVTLRQTPSQINRARNANAQIRVSVNVPASISLRASRVANGTLS